MRRVRFVEEEQEAVITALRDLAALHCSQHCAARLLMVSAVAEAAFVNKPAKITEIPVEFFRREVPQTERPDPGCVGDKSAGCEWM
jgi:hypothetical protein